MSSDDRKLIDLGYKVLARVVCGAETTLSGLLLERNSKLHADRQQGGDATTAGGVLYIKCCEPCCTNKPLQLHSAGGCIYSGNAFEAHAGCSYRKKWRETVRVQPHNVSLKAWLGSTSRAAAPQPQPACAPDEEVLGAAWATAAAAAAASRPIERLASGTAPAAASPRTPFGQQAAQPPPLATTAGQVGSGDSSHLPANSRAGLAQDGSGSTVFSLPSQDCQLPAVDTDQVQQEKQQQQDQEGAKLPAAESRGIEAAADGSTRAAVAPANADGLVQQPVQQQAQAQQLPSQQQQAPQQAQAGRPLHGALGRGSGKYPLPQVLAALLAQAGTHRQLPQQAQQAEQAQTTQQQQQQQHHQQHFVQPRPGACGGPCLRPVAPTPASTNALAAGPSAGPLLVALLQQIMQQARAHAGCLQHLQQQLAALDRRIAQLEQQGRGWAAGQHETLEQQAAKQVAPQQQLEANIAGLKSALDALLGGQAAADARSATPQQQAQQAADVASLAPPQERPPPSLSHQIATPNNKAAAARPELRQPTGLCGSKRPPEDSHAEEDHSSEATESA